MNNGTTITGYLSGQSTYCPECIRDLLLPFELIGGPELSAEQVLDQVARQRGLNRQDESSYSSYQFPFPLRLATTSDADRCVLCGHRLLDGPRA